MGEIIAFDYEGNLYDSFCESLNWLKDELDILNITDQQERRKIILFANKLPLAYRGSNNVR